MLKRCHHSIIMNAKTNSSKHGKMSTLPPAVNSAFKAQSRREHEQLKSTLAESLSEDMKKLLAEGTFADLTLINEGEQIPIHSTLLKIRLADFFSVIEPHISVKEDNEKVADLSTLGVTSDQLQELLRVIYTEDKILPYWVPFQETLKSHDSLEPMECQPTDLNTATVKQNTNDKTNASEETQNHSLASNCSQENCSVEKQQTRDVKSGNKTGVPGVLAMDVCEYVTLESAKPETGCEPGTALKNIEMSGEHLTYSDKFIKGSKSEETDVPGNLVSKEKQSSVKTNTTAQFDRSSKLVPTAASMLGRDLLHLLVSDSTQHDVTIRVDGKEIPAHRFMLCARSQYFSAMLEGTWRESSSSEIELTGFSYDVVMLAIQFIYGGAYKLPDGAILGEMLFLADMYGLDLLKTVVEFKLRRDYCHFFHAPCNECLQRIPECLLLSGGVISSDLEERILRWLVEHLDRSWRQKTFASLPQNILFKCREFAIQSFSPQSAVKILLQVDRLVCNLPRVSWAKAVHDATMHLLDACTQYMATNFQTIVRTESFRNLLEGMNWKQDLMEPVFSRVVPTLTLDMVSGTFLVLHSLHDEMRDELDDIHTWNPDAVSAVQLLYSQFFSYMASNVNLIAQAEGWDRLSSHLKEIIQDEGLFIESRKKTVAPKPVLTSSLKNKRKPHSKGT